MKKHIANIITFCRIIGSIILLFIPISLVFYIMYILWGFSDMIDGTIARKTNSVTDFGSKIDTVADILFLTVSFIKLLPTINIPLWLLIWCGIIAVIKIVNIIWGFVAKKQFISLHTPMNKVTGFLLFLLPLIVPFFKLNYITIAVCIIATFSAIQETLFIAIYYQNK